MSNNMNTDTGVNTTNPDNDPQFNLHHNLSQSVKDSDMYQKICQEFVQMKHNYDRVKVAQAALRNTALQQSSLDNLIKASLNPLGASRSRIDSLANIRETHFGRKRAMTVDGPIKEKYAQLNHTKKSAFSSFKQAGKDQEIIPDTKDEDEESKEGEAVGEPRLSKKRTHVIMAKEFPSHSQQLLLSPTDDFPTRKRAKSF